MQASDAWPFYLVLALFGLYIPYCCLKTCRPHSQIDQETYQQTVDKNTETENREKPGAVYVYL